MLYKGQRKQDESEHKRICSKNVVELDLNSKKDHSKERTDFSSLCINVLLTLLIDNPAKNTLLFKFIDSVHLAYIDSYPLVLCVE